MFKLFFIFYKSINSNKFKTFLKLKNCNAHTPCIFLLLIPIIHNQQLMQSCFAMESLFKKTYNFSANENLNKVFFIIGASLRKHRRILIFQRFYIYIYIIGYIKVIVFYK